MSDKLYVFATWSQVGICMWWYNFYSTTRNFACELTHKIWTRNLLLQLYQEAKVPTTPTEHFEAVAACFKGYSGSDVHNTQTEHLHIGIYPFNLLHTVLTTGVGFSNPTNAQAVRVWLLFRNSNSERQLGEALPSAKYIGDRKLRTKLKTLLLAVSGRKTSSPPRLDFLAKGTTYHSFAQINITHAHVRMVYTHTHSH